MILSKFNIKYVDRKAIKGQVIADQLEEAPLQDDHPLNIEFLAANILIVTKET